MVSGLGELDLWETAEALWLVQAADATVLETLKGSRLVPTRKLRLNQALHSCA